MMNARLLIFDNNDEVIGKLLAAFDGRPELSARRLEPSKIAKLPDLDALYLTLPAAERWNPRLLFYKSQVLKTEAEDSGWPRYIVAGIAMKPDDPRAGIPSEELKLAVKAVLDAVESYNQENQFPIGTIGFWSRDLRIGRMDTSRAGEIIRSVYDQHYS